MSFSNPTNFTKKLLATSFIVLSFLFIIPQKAHAQYVDISQASKEWAADGFAWWAIKKVLKNVIASTISWANSGFKRNPA